MNITEHVSTLLEGFDFRNNNKESEEEFLLHNHKTSVSSFPNMREVDEVKTTMRYMY